MDANLRAGIAVFNAGYFHAAHDAWEDHWLSLEAGTDDERLLHGLIQFTAAVHHAQHANWAGVRGLAERAAGYLDGLAPDYRAVNVETVRTYLRSVATDPEFVERAAPPTLELNGQALALDDLEFPALSVAAAVLAEAGDRYDDGVVQQAVAFASDVVEAREASSAVGEDRFVALVTDFVHDADHRDLIYERLRAHVEKQVAEREDVDGLFG